MQKRCERALTSGRSHLRLSDAPLPQADSCGWALPDDVVITLSSQTMSLLDEVPLTFRGDLAAGDCSISVDAMQPRFAGRWSCFFTSGGHTVWTSPAHLHLQLDAQARTGQCPEEGWEGA